ncbi:unnamed protein product [Acanthoscelides obtectus]|uniref:Protein sleepless n=1 Tax=Acanthoscelides obtectus TaxID=200917 RepID=A0A9P0LL96_ACAOB|nr:unnamed protein product [Acanthoscelides obtectus]CAH2013675.1 unnamed protein product [Acanthoscelides obtectus]CAK1651796.1 hypothetical protein AOBTE_LOCUS17457 [Acanthoscelides obtectus]CAK1682515.1 hypothetical protein AOBTE_LOCUS33688 [Acanthoscelides obtectus]
MKFSMFTLVKVFLLLIFIENAVSIKCWECRSDADPKCSDPFDNTTLAITDCKQLRSLDYLPNVQATMCRKIRQKVHGVWKYIRSCAYLGEPGLGGDERFCLMRTGTYNIFMEYCTCNTKDGCNTASSLKLQSLLMWCSVLAFITCRYLR